MRHGVSSGSRRGIRVHGRRAPAPARRPPRDRGRARHRRLQRGRRRSASCTRRWPAAYPGARPTSRSTPADLAGLDVVFLCAARTAQSQAIAGDARRHRRPRRRPRRRLPAPGRRLRAVVRRARTPRPSCSTASRSACPSSTATRSSPRAHVAVARLLPDGRVARARAAARRRARRADRHRRRRGVGRLGRGPRPEGHEPLRRGDENVTAYGLLTHRHTAEMEQALDARRRRSRCRCCSRRTSCR